MNTPVNIGICGTGSVVIRGTLPHLTMDDIKDRVNVRGLFDPVIERAQEAARRFSIEKVYQTYEEMLLDEGLDAITISSPIGLHYEQGKLALEHGKHLHFNKTMTTTCQEASELIDLASENNLKIVSSPGEMLRPHNRHIKRLIETGVIGELCWAICGAAFGDYHHEESVRSGEGVLENVNPAWYFKKPGGGPLYDMTVYALHGMTGILGPVKKVTAMSGKRIPVRFWRDERIECESDDNSIILMDFENGAFAVAYGTAYGAVTEHFTGSYFGTTGSIVGNKLNGKQLEYPGYELANLSKSWIDGNQQLLPHVRGEHINTEEQHVFEDIMQLVDWILDDIAPVPTAEHARHVIEIIESAYRASGTGETQTLTTTFPQLSKARIEALDRSLLTASIA